MIVVDASAAVHLGLRRALDRLMPHRPVSPSLLWSEVASALRQLAWRGDIEDAHAEEVLRRLAATPIRFEPSASLAGEAFALAAQLSWAKTYDAEYLALAGHLGCPLLTIDARLARTAERLVGLVPLDSI